MVLQSFWSCFSTSCFSCSCCATKELKKTDQEIYKKGSISVYQTPLFQNDGNSEKEKKQALASVIPSITSKFQSVENSNVVSTPVSDGSKSARYKYLRHASQHRVTDQHIGKMDNVHFLASEMYHKHKGEEYTSILKLASFAKICQIQNTFAVIVDSSLTNLAMTNNGFAMTGHEPLNLIGRSIRTFALLDAKCLNMNSLNSAEYTKSAKLLAKGPATLIASAKSADKKEKQAFTIELMNENHVSLPGQVMLENVLNSPSSSTKEDLFVEVYVFPYGSSYHMILFRKIEEASSKVFEQELKVLKENLNSSKVEKQIRLTDVDIYKSGCVYCLKSVFDSPLQQDHFQTIVKMLAIAPHIYNQQGEMTIVCDQDFIIVALTNNMETLLEYKPYEILTRSLIEFITSDTEKFLMQCKANGKRSTPLPISTKFPVNKDKTFIPKKASFDAVIFVQQLKHGHFLLTIKSKELKTSQTTETDAKDNLTRDVSKTTSSSAASPTTTLLRSATDF